MSSRNKFGFGPLDPGSTASRRDRGVGPMGAAVREAAEDLHASTEAKVEQRRRNAEDAKAFRAAREAGRVLVSLPLDRIGTDDLPRDRLELEAVAVSDEMEELKASIRARGQKEPIEVYEDELGGYQLKKGWRRLTALRQLHVETGDRSFSEVVARIEAGESQRIARYIDMVEENVVREDLTFAEMAQVAITAAADPGTGEGDADAMVGRLYTALHKTKRSYIRSFVSVLETLGDDLRWPKAVKRDLGVEVARTLKGSSDIPALRTALSGCSDPEAQNRILGEFVSVSKRSTTPDRPAASRPKLEFHLGATKVTARQGECRIVSQDNFAEISRERLERAVKAFERELRAGSGGKS